MKRAGHALVFTDSTTGSEFILSIVQNVGLVPMRPHELAQNTKGVSIIIIDRSPQNSVSICSNLRKQPDFTEIPMLVLLESPTQEQVAQLTAMHADLFFKPVVEKALVRYLTSKASAQSETISSDSSFAAPTEILPPSEAVTEKQIQPEIPFQAIDDFIPSSNRMLPSTIALAEISKGGVTCAHCRHWRVRRDDAFCSKCGVPLAVLETPEDAVFEPFGQHKVGKLIELKNAGQNPLRMSFRLVADKQLEQRFSLHTHEAVLDGGYSEHLLAIFDARRLDISIRYQAVLEIASNASGYTKRQVPLIVERLPIPRIIADDGCKYVLGAENYWEFRLANDGGGTLALTRLRMEEIGLLETPAELEMLSEAKVLGGKPVPVSVRVPELDLTPGNQTRRMICEFEHHSPITVDLQIEVVRPARLAVQPPELDFGVISTMRQQKLLMTLVNGGGEELIVESLAPSVEWAHCLAQTPLRIGQGGTFLLDVQVQGSLELAGEHTGEIEIRSNSYQTPIQTIPFIVKFVSPTPYEDYIGIDFGTTASCIAVLDKNDHPLIIPLDAPEPTSQADPRIMPSVAFLQSDGTILTGYEALSAAAIEPANAVTSIKRALGQKHKEGLSGQGFDPTALTAKIINQLVIRTENALFSMGEYKTPRRAIITVPVEFFDNQRRALLKACEMAGLETHSSSDHGVVIDEAHAAALYYMSKKQQEETSGHERLLIFDFGGGTLDCALIQIEVADRKVLLKTLALGGDPQLGGVDIDWALVGLLADRAKSEFPEFDINCVGDQQKFGHLYHTPGITQPANITRAHFKQQAEQAKIALTKAPAFELTINRLLRIGATPLEPYLTNSQGTAHFNVTVMQEELSSIVEPFIQRASRVVETICQRANIALEDVHTILHTGRTSLLPLVRERINAMLPNAVDRSQLIEPKLCVALGAAFWGYIKDLPNAAFEFVGGANRLIHDIGYIDFNTGMLRQIFVPVFPAQTEFPCEEMIELPLSKNLVTLQLAENRGKNILTEDNTEIKKVGRVRIDASGTSGNILPVRFAIDENRVIEITANGQTQTIEMMDE